MQTRPLAATPSVKTQYEVELFEQQGRISLGRRPVPEDHLERCREWMLFQAQRHNLAFAEAGSRQVLDEPCFAAGQEGRISGILMSVSDGAERWEHKFPLHVFQSVADDFLAQLIEAGSLDGDTCVLYRAYARSVPPAPAADGVVARVRRTPPRLLDGRLADWLDRSALLGTTSAADYPLFMEQSVTAEAMSESWAGRRLEGGAWLVGNLYRQRDPPEIFGVIHSVLEAAGMTHERDRLDLSAQTYLHLQEQLQRRRVRMGRVGELAMGFIHSHPFLPSELDGRESCQGCTKRSTCTVTSAFLSRRDAQFHGAVFGAAPYAVQMVLGRTPRNELDLRMFCLDGGRFRQRGYHGLAAVAAEPV
jgi:hypothetical protein